MRNKIPCSADRLGLLDPQMIQAVSDASAFQIGQQYVSENRVRIVEADNGQISSAVIGNSGLYEQTIRLRDGHLVTKCSCTLPEEPMCRHSIAVLLEYHRWSQPRHSRRSELRETKHQAQQQLDPVNNGKAASMPSSVPDVKLGEVMQFVEWLQPSMKAIDKHERLPDSPALSTGEVGYWIQTIRKLEEGRRESEDLHTTLKAEMKDREAYIGRLTQQLQTSMAEAKAAQAAFQEVQRELTVYKGMLSKVGELGGEIARYDGQMKSVATEILTKGNQLDKLAHSFKEVSEALKVITKQTPLR